MAQGCLKCLKITMCIANFLCFMCGAAVLGFGVYLMVQFPFAALTPTLAQFSIARMLLISGIIISCVSFLGFLGALKENRCLLLTFFLLLFLLMLVELAAACLLLMHEKLISVWLEEDLKNGLKEAKGTSSNSTQLRSDWDLLQNTLHCCGVNNATDWEGNVPNSCEPEKTKTVYDLEGCLAKLEAFFEENFVTTGISVIVLCIIEVLGMCFAMTLFCHISRSGLGYKL